MRQQAISRLLKGSLAAVEVAVATASRKACSRGVDLVVAILASLTGSGGQALRDSPQLRERATQIHP